MWWLFVTGYGYGRGRGGGRGAEARTGTGTRMQCCRACDLQVPRDAWSDIEPAHDGDEEHTRQRRERREAPDLAVVSQRPRRRPWQYGCERAPRARATSLSLADPDPLG
jgi:hypothetical protein